VHELGLSSENAAHRVAVEWTDAAGPHEGVYITRRDTGSSLNHLAGGRLFPGEHQRAKFQVVDDEREIALHMLSSDGLVEIDVFEHEAERLPDTSVFSSVGDASAFFESGGIGYSVTASGRRLDGVVLKTDSWNVAPFAIERAHLTYFDDCQKFPAGSIQFDCALVIRNVPHQWESAADLELCRKPVADGKNRPSAARI
jgi:hypothetical protein